MMENLVTAGYGDGIIDGFKISQETLEHLDPIKRAVGVELVKQGRWIFVPTFRTGMDNTTPDSHRCPPQENAISGG